MNNKLKILAMFVFLLIAYLFTSVYINKEVPLYVCDLVEQNVFWHDFSVLLKENVSQFALTFANDIYWHNRNPFLILPLLPFAFIFKEFRLGFIFSVEIVYLLPVLLLILYLFNEYFLKQKEISHKEFFMYISSIFLFPTIWYSVISGLPDIGGMIPVLICFLLYFKYGFNKKISPKILIIFSVLLYLSFLSRRWYSVVLTAFCLSIIIENFIISLKTDNKLKQIGYTFFNLGIAVFIFLVLANIIQGGYFRNIIPLEMAERAAFVANFNQLPVLTLQHLGLFVCITSLIAVVFFIKNKLIRFSSLNIIIYLFMYIVVMNNQLLWINHFAYIAVLISIIFCAGLFKIYDLIKNDKLKTVFVAFIVIFNVVNFFTFFLADKPPVLRFILPKTAAYPLQSASYDKIYDLYEYLENEYNKNNNIKVGIYGINENLGYWQFRSINPNNEFAKKAMGFERILNSDFDDAKYDEDFVILFNPPGIYAPDESSTKIKEVVEMFKNNTGFAEKYKKVKETELKDINTTKVILYKRK